MAKPADTRWLERLLQTKEQTTEAYVAWCTDMAMAFMDFAKEYEQRDDYEAAVRCQRIAKTMKAEVEKILKDG